MAKRKNSHYVVWIGAQPGIYDSWQRCEQQVKGFPKALYKGFSSLALAEQAWQDGAEQHWGNAAPKPTPSASQLPNVAEALCVDAACNMQSRIMEYRGVWLSSGKLAFARGPYNQAMNNVGEYLALVHGIIYLRRQCLQLPIYSDSRTALSWCNKLQIKSPAMLAPDFNPRLRRRALLLQSWLRQRQPQQEIRKWDTQRWGEIPADYGNK